MWRLRFRLRFVLLIFTFASILMAICAIADHRLREGIREVEALGGRAHLNVDCDDEGQLPGPFFKERALPARIAYFWSSQISPLRRIVSIELNGSGVSDSDLRRLSRYDKLIRLNLSYTQISDAGLVHLASLKQLRFVELYETNVTTAGLMALGKQNPTLTVKPSDKAFDQLIEKIIAPPENFHLR